MILKILKKAYYFLGSIKLAVPAMLFLMLVIAIGTILESRYNADYAKMMIYQSWWFNTLIITIWFNILFATLTRLPWKKHHIGFLVTHLGLLMIFGGGFLTNVFGIDGSLSVMEGDSSRYVILSDLVLSVRSGNEQMGTDYSMTRWTSQKDASHFNKLNEKLRGLMTISGYEPFVDAKEVLVPNPNAPIQEPFEIQFQIKSAFFNVQQGLNSQGQSSMNMGPASFRLIKENSKAPVTKKPGKKVSAVLPLNEKIRVVASEAKAKGDVGVLVVQLGENSKQVKISPTAKVQVGEYSVQIKKIYIHASIVNNGLQENAAAPVNPALEVEISKGNEKVRDVLYAKFPGFSLRKDKFKELQVSAKMVVEGQDNPTTDSPEAAAMPAGHPTVSSTEVTAAAPTMGGSASSPNGNQVLFYYSDAHPTEVRVELWKAGKMVETKSLKQGDKYQTPWMGMELTLLQMAWNAQKEIQVTPTQPVEKMQQLPPSAIRINRWEGAPAEETWLLEGEEKTLAFDGRKYVIYYGRKIIELPFIVNLKAFKKTDYPGTAMAKEYESHVQVVRGMNMMSAPIKISMNEPLQEAGYTLYQASFQEVGSGKFASILSVNLDPGRWFKYFGGIILAIGIITYTLSKSRRFKAYFN